MVGIGSEIGGTKANQKTQAELILLSSYSVPGNVVSILYWLAHLNLKKIGGRYCSRLTA